MSETFLETATAAVLRMDPDAHIESVRYSYVDEVGETIDHELEIRFRTQVDLSVDLDRFLSKEPLCRGVAPVGGETFDLIVTVFAEDGFVLRPLGEWTPREECDMVITLEAQGAIVMEERT